MASEALRTLRRHGTPPKQAIADALRDQIREGRYAPGEPIPSLSALRETYDVAIGTARAAVAIIEDDGLVQAVQGRGTVVVGKHGKGRVHARESIAAELSARIASGDLAPGELVPPTQAIADEFGVAKATARAAVRMLADAGLVAAEGVAWRVTGPTEPTEAVT
jgi:DNA-binding GntR family transcriptional regulator